MERYQTTHFVIPENLNVHGTLYAGRGTEWFVEAGFVAAAATHGQPKDLRLVKIHEMEFKKSIPNSDIIHFWAQVVRAGSTSLTVAVEAVSELTKETAVTGFITFVIVDYQTGEKKPHGIKLDEANDQSEQSLREKAELFFVD